MLLRRIDATPRAAVRAGFTLMELLVVVAILLVLVGVATPLYLKYLDQSKVKIARTDAFRLASELKNYAASNQGNYPQGMPSFEILVLEGFLEREPLDPWGQPFQWTLRPVGLDGTTMTPVVWSAGPNLTDEGGAGDDISNLP